jgi:hypothetical protein
LPFFRVPGVNFTCRDSSSSSSGEIWSMAIKA